MDWFIYHFRLFIPTQDTAKKPPAKRAKKAKKIEIEYETEEIDLEPGQSILSNIVEQEVN